MNPAVESLSFIEDCRRALTRFWDDALAVEASRDGAVLALPLMLPNGLQVVIHLSPVSEATAILSDRGETLGRLVGEGMNLSAEGVSRMLDERLATFEIQRDGWELRKVIRLPLEGMDIQLFGEALVSLAHLIYRHEPEATSEPVADRTVQRLFEERGLKPLRNHGLPGRLANRINVDYFLDQGGGLAVEVVSRKTQILPYMEQWGWRWSDLRQRNPRLVRAMIYDPEVQVWDSNAVEIGQSVCEVFCPYFEIEKLGDAVEKHLSE